MRYYGTALLLGLGWCAILLIPDTTRAWLLTSGDSLMNLLALLATSVVTARIFRRWITTARSRRANLLRALLIPWAGCVIYLTVYNGYAGAMDFLNTGRVNVHDSVVLYYWGFVYVLLVGYVVFPYSFLCQWLLNRTGKDPA